MKCPHCNQEHPDGFQFCPVTGKKIELMKACPNPNCPDLGKYILPLDSRYCPTCGSLLDEESADNTEFEYGKEWSSRIQFNNGDIVVNGVTLGKDSLLDFIKTKCTGHHKEGKVSLDTITDGIYAIVPQLEFDEIGGLFSSFSDKVTVNRMFPFHLLEKVAWLHIEYSSFPLFNDLGISSCNDIQENASILENTGYLRIKNFIKAVEDDNNVASFVSKTLNGCGNHTFLVLYDDFMYAYDGLLTQWIPYDDDIDDSDNNGDDDNDNDDELHRFFPIGGIIIGETTIEDAEGQDYLYDGIDYHDANGNASEYYDEDGASVVWYKGVQFRKEKNDYTITNIYLTHFSPIFEEWEELGFDWNLSYTEWRNLFISMGYEIQVEEEPHKEYYDTQGYWYLQAKFRAYAPDYSIQFKLDFSFGSQGFHQRSKSTLYSLSVYSGNSSHWYSDYD